MVTTRLKKRWRLCRRAACDMIVGGAKLLAPYPVSVLTDGLGLNITVVGYLGQLHFGLVGCRELVPDIDVLAGYLTDELEPLLKAAGSAR